MPQHKTFCGFGAYAVDVKDPNATVVMLLRGGSDLQRSLDPQRFVTLNLNHRLDAASWDNAILDTVGLNAQGNMMSLRGPYPTSAIDPATGKPIYSGIQILTVGPDFPGVANIFGGIYMERNKFFSNIRPRLGGKNDWPCVQFQTYQRMSSALLENQVLTRYHGFHAKVLAVQGSTKLLDVQHEFGTSQVWADISRRDVCDDPTLVALDIQDPIPSMPQERTIDMSSPVGDAGAIFLSLKTCVANNLSGPKEPIGR